MRISSKRVSGAAAALPLLAILPAHAAAAPAQAAGDASAGSAASAAAAGRDLYLRFCAPCHGGRGDGAGPIAGDLDPAPRDLSAGVYRYRSTASGTLPLPADLARTVDEGLRGTAMPGWRGVIPPAGRDALVRYLMDLSPRFADEGVGDPVAVPAETPRPPDLAARGRALYDKLQCAECHGREGRGDGPALPTLRDDRGRPLAARDLTRRAGLKQASSPRDLVRTLVTGLDGAAMPSYADALAPGEAWDLARWLWDRARPARWWERFLLVRAGTWQRE